MTDKKMVVVDQHLLGKIDRHRGQLTRSGFVGACIERQLEKATISPKPVPPPISTEPGDYVTWAEFEKFRGKMDQIHQEFMDFFIKYAGQLAGEKPNREDTEQFGQELRRLLLR